MEGSKSQLQRERPIRVLSASIDQGLNHARGLLLKHHGFDVTSESLEEARQLITNGSYDVLIFGSTLPRDTCWQLAEIFRKTSATGRIVEILPSPWTAPKNKPDATVDSSAEPTELVSVIRLACS
jgi:hypothetical protein